MRKKCLFTILLFVPVVTSSLTAQNLQSARPAWEAKPEFLRLSERLGDIDPTLPAPKLLPEPPYTTGRRNTLHWSNTDTRAVLRNANIDGNLLFYEVRAYSDSTGQLWGYVPAETDSATFQGLPSGVPIYYNLRYFFQFRSGEYGLSFWNTDSTFSIQDVSPPEFTQWEIVGLNSSGNKNWVTERTIDLHVLAHDPDNGQVAQVRVVEASTTYENKILYDIDIPLPEVDLLIPYEIGTDQHIPISLELQVIDVAGQGSEIRTIHFFWWKLEEMVCFPNPFNPELGEISTIETGNTEITDARIYDPFGNLVIKLSKNRSTTFFQWDGRNSDGKIVSNGGYFCVIDSDQKQYCKIAVIK